MLSMFEIIVASSLTIRQQLITTHTHTHTHTERERQRKVEKEKQIDKDIVILIDIVNER